MQFLIDAIESQLDLSYSDFVYIMCLIYLLKYKCTTNMEQMMTKVITQEFNTARVEYGQ